ncbi:Zn-dependent hydrolase [Acuticoccus sp. M5D2P5]|uniref:Zn-dependent hydrolase n=1 Tax=Acuticoccus kalidii TaxID=2910977 RepID=UPI001F3CE813|nr:Zn-dependent hydrolase [Acuticoccus kalidii]MCF3934786.1 Zn-dependent hydrolase [Acuticoccus kalidii]
MTTITHETLLSYLQSGAESAFLTAIFDLLRARDTDEPGITREAFGAGEDAAFDLVEALADALGLVTTRDAIGNLSAVWGADQPGPHVIIGSHLDSVPHGGNFDGAAGIVSGLMVLARLVRAGERPAQPVELLVLRCEESAWFGRAYVGSLTLLGGLTAKDLTRRHLRSKTTLGDCLAARGVDIAKVKAGERLRDPAGIAAYYEVHIEQGPVMTARGFPVAPVTGIRGNRRFLMNSITGEAGHSGAVPRWLRRDAVFAYAELISALDAHWQVLMERGIDLVVTSGIVGTDPERHSITAIPGEIRFSLEFRSQSEATLDAFEGLVRAECEAIGTRRNVDFALDDVLASAPASLDAALTRGLTEAIAELGLTSEALPSGAGHDAAVFSNAGIPAAMLFVRNENGSHNPAETMDLDDLAVAVDVLHKTVLARIGAKQPA